MATETVHMKVARATEKEIDNVRDLLNEIASLDQDFQHQYYFDAINENKEDFPLLSKIVTDDRDDFIDNLARLVNNTFYDKVLFNLNTLMENCADMNADTLEFNERITKGLELLERQQWISIEDKMPDYDGDYLCSIKNPQPCGNIWKYCKVVNCSMNKWIIEDDGETVTHWMPLPELPKESEANNV